MNQTEYVQKAKAQLDRLDGEIDKMTAKAKEASAEARETYLKETAQLKEHRKDVHDRLENLGKSSGEAWKEVQSGFESAWNSLQSSMERARERFS